jgi:hypothetical protein
VELDMLRHSSLIPLMVLCFLSIGVTACDREEAAEAAPPSVAATALRLDAPSQIAAGEALALRVYTTPPNATTPILLIAQGTFGFYPLRLTPDAGRAHFTIPPVQTRHAGIVTLRATADGVLATTTVEITPGPVADPVLPLVGPRSIVADGEHWTMAVTTPRDALGNPVAEGTTLTLYAQHPTAPELPPATGLELIPTRTRNLLSWARIYSRTRAGRLLISATAGGGHSPERVVLEVPGPPLPFTLHAEPLTAPADGQQWIRLHSDQITDQYGNILLDGANATILAAMPPDAVRTLPATTVDGRIYTTLQAPARSGFMFVRAWIGGASSLPIMLTFTPGPAVTTIALQSAWRADGIELTAGPLVGDRGQFVPDGTEVTFTITGPIGLSHDGALPQSRVRQIVAPSEYGYATILVRTLTLLPGRYVVAAAAGTGEGNTIFEVPETIGPDQPAGAAAP